MPDLSADPSSEPVEYLNATAAACSGYQGWPIADGYRYLVKFFGCALIDRTETLQPGFPYRVIDPIPAQRPGLPALDELCDARGAELLSESEREDRELRVLWSGGIDSTAALVALLRAAERSGGGDRIRVFLSAQSIEEHRWFFHRVIEPNLAYHRIETVSDALDPDSLIVTGEHGDQIFGSALAADYLKKKYRLRRVAPQLFEPWRDLLPVVFCRRLNFDEALEAEGFLLPQLAHSPVPLRTLFDVLWWINFSMKWQTVTLRLPTYRPEHYRTLIGCMRHFFRHDDFQRWSLANHESKIGKKWKSYKMPLKRYINDYFDDPDYLKNKLKIGSLNAITETRSARIYAFGQHQISIESGRGDSLASDSEE